MYRTSLVQFYSRRRYVLLVLHHVRGYRVNCGNTRAGSSCTCNIVYVSIRVRCVYVPHSRQCPRNRCN